MKLDLNTLRDKVAGCWAGKNIGGTLGAPFEWHREINYVDFYTQDLSMGPPANDDLDLQIVWLAAAERYGRQVDASILGEYWLSYVIPEWVEYGTGKANMKAGLVPPLSGEVDNVYKNSCGCFIRSEIWACLAPGHPELAARYAYEDAIVDHAGEGVYGEIFFAAMESAAFVESDPRTLIGIGLSYIPDDCVTAKAIREAVACCEQELPLPQTRLRIHNVAPGTFGVQYAKLSEIDQTGDNEGFAVGEPGFDAPENVAFAIAGWLMGGGDFEKGICLTNAFGEDTDCSCGSLGALMGIILGASRLPEKWTKPLDDKIVTICIRKTTGGVWIPKTTTELAERVLRTVPLFLGGDCDVLDEGGMSVTCEGGDALCCRREQEYLTGVNGGHKDLTTQFRDVMDLSPYVVRKEYPAFRLELDHGDSPFFTCGRPRTIRVRAVNTNLMNQQQWVRFTLYTPEGVTVEGSRVRELPLNNVVGAQAETSFTVNTECFSGGRLELLVDAALNGRHSYGVIKATLLCRD